MVLAGIQVELSSEYAPELIGLPGKSPLLSWKISGAEPTQHQISAELQSSATQSFSDITSQVNLHGFSDQSTVAPAEDFTSRQEIFYRVRIATPVGWSNWSNTVRIEMGLLHPDDFVGLAIGEKSSAQGPATLLRKTFSVSQRVSRARLYATSHGVFTSYLNGEQVGDDHLAPGWTSYQDRILVSTHDVSDQLRVGENAWGVLLGDGWYRGKFGFVNQVDNYGSQTSFLAQLEIIYEDGTSETIATDESWLATFGEIRMGSIYDGCDQDFDFARRGWTEPQADESGWVNATTFDFDKTVLEPRAAAPIRTVAEIEPLLNQRGFSTRVDVGQNISGWLRLRVMATPGSRVVVRHAEVLELDGALHTAALRGARSIDTYKISEGGIQTLEPKLTFHGFQFADIEIEGEVQILQVTAVAISSDNKARSTFESSVGLLNQLHNNTRWSLLDNFISIPTDCPQRDERLGWTGDAQAFSFAAHTLVDCFQFFKSWLVDLKHEQRKLGGKVPLVVPDLLSMQLPADSPFNTPYGFAGWSDAATVLPWSMYERFGHESILADQIDSMRAWVEHNSSDHAGLLIPERLQLGDWLDPDAPEGQPWAAKVSGRFIANAYLAHSTNLLARAEAVLGNRDRAALLHERFEQLKSAIWRELSAEAMQSTTGAALLLEYDLAPESHRKTVAATLAHAVNETSNRISTGFLGTPVILDALSKNGYAKEAFGMLLRTEMLSWLYPITMGATTIWERWNAILEDGTISGGSLESSAEGSGDGMISFNHYAYGAVVDWMYRNLGGIAPVEPGYRKVSIQPLLHASVDFCRSSIDTKFGTISLEWKVENSEFVADLKVPFGVTVTVDLPVAPLSELTVNDSPQENGCELNHGTYRINLTHPVIII